MQHIETQFIQLFIYFSSKKFHTLRYMLIYTCTWFNTTSPTRL